MLNILRYGEIHYYQNIIGSPSDIIDIIENSDHLMSDDTAITKWKDWGSSDGDYIFGMQKRQIEGKEKNASSDVLYAINKIIDSIKLASNDYRETHSIDIGTLAPISISKYFVGKEMGPHCDNYGKSVTGPVISVVGYLNDNYEGGEIYFRDQDIKIKPSAGSIVVFPSNEPYFHQSLEIKSGVKYMCPGFWYKR